MKKEIADNKEKQQISVAFGSLIGVGAGSVLSIALGKGDKRMQERLMGNVNLAPIRYLLLPPCFSLCRFGFCPWPLRKQFSD